MSEGQCNTGSVSKLYTSTFTDARQSASDRGVYCITTVDFRGSGQSLAHDLLLMDLVVHAR